MLLSSLARVVDLKKCLFLNDEKCMVGHTIIDMNPAELKYYQLMISLNKCTESCNFLSPEIGVPKETRDVSVEAFDLMINKDEAKAMTEQI